MNIEFFHTVTQSQLFLYIILPVLIFFSRIIDVSIGTMRVIFVSRGYKVFAMICGFFEVLIWLIAITQIMHNLSNIFCYIAYAGGFASGNFVGMMIEEKIALGNVLIRVVTSHNFDSLSEYLKSCNLGVTVLPAKGIHGNVMILFTVVPRQTTKSIITNIRNMNPHAFYTIEDIRFVNENHFFHGGDFTNSWVKSRIYKKPFRKGK